MSDTSIEWTDKTWNPVVGCRRVSPGCEHCYAEHMAGRIARMGGAHSERYQRVVRLGESLDRSRWNGRFEEVPSALAAPLSWRKPARVFVNSMSDLFGEGVSDEYIAAVFGVMAAAPRHTFQVLTKRAERMAQWFADHGALTDFIGALIETHALDEEMAMRVIASTDLSGGIRWPLPNVWIGVSVEDQQHADERAAFLRTVPAAVPWYSVEPMLGPIDRLPLDGISWCVIGGESGPGARPFDLAWARSIVAQCRAAGVPVFVKQLGARPMEMAGEGAHPGEWADHPVWLNLRDRKGGDMNEWPEDLRVREWPSPEPRR